MYTPPIVVVQRTTNDQMTCHAICFENDFKELVSERRLMNPSIQTMQESLFKKLHPVAYQQYVESDLSYCIGIWLLELFDGKKKYTKDGDAFYTDSFFIWSPGPKRLSVVFYLGCNCTQAAALVLMFKDRLGLDWNIEVQETSLFSEISLN